MLGPLKDSWQGIDDFQVPMGMGPMMSGRQAGCHSPAGLRCRLPQCQFMTSAVHERRPHRRGGEMLAAEDGT